MLKISYPKSSEEAFYRKNETVVLCHGSKDIIYWIVLTATCREPNVSMDDLRLLQRKLMTFPVTEKDLT